MTNQTRQTLGRINQPGEIDSRVVSHQFKAMYDFFGANIARRPRGIGAAADAT